MSGNETRTPTHQDCYVAQAAIRDLLNRRSQLPLQVCMDLRRLLRAVESQIELIEPERKDLIDRFGEKDSEGQPVIDEAGQVRIRAEHTEECQTRFRELMAMEWPDAPRVSLAGMGDRDVDFNLIVALDPFLSD
jgi:transposase